MIEYAKFLSFVLSIRHTPKQAKLTPLLIIMPKDPWIQLIISPSAEWVIGKQIEGVDLGIKVSIPHPSIFINVVT